jgi:AcrR family transcriptional regulator
VPPASRRATALAPDDRRAMLVATTLELVMESGADVSTRQIAEAAGVAEGTIFRVFDTKEELLRAAWASVFDPSALVTELGKVDRSAGLEDRLGLAVEALQAHVRRVIRVLYALRSAREPAMRPTPRTGPPGHRHPDDAEAILAALVDLIEPDAAQLRFEPQEAARRLHLVTFAGSHPMITHGQPLTAPEIVSLLLDGIRAPGSCAVPAALSVDPSTPSRGDRSC